MYDYARWDSMDSKWVVEGQKARDRIEYESFLRDAKKIEAIRKRVNFKEFGEVEKLYSSICTQSIKFESKIGFDFEDEVAELYENLKIINASKVASKKPSKPSKKVVKENNTFNSSSSRNSDRKEIFDRENFEDEDYDYRSRSNRYSRRNIEDDEEELYGDYIKNHQRVEIREDSVDKELVDYYIDKRRKGANAVKFVIIGFCLVAIIGSFSAVIFKYASDKKNERILREIDQANHDNAFIFTTIKTTKKNRSNSYTYDENEDATVTLDTYELPDLLEKYKDSYSKNNDLIGWIKIDDTYIDYPVVQGNDNSFYLSHNFKGASDGNGCIFADMNCSIFPRSKNVILYGHHMKSGKMFAQIEKYDNYEFYAKHRSFRFDTILEQAEYEIAFVFRDYVHASDDTGFKYYEFVDVTSETEFNSYMKELKDKSLYDTGIIPTFDDELLTLSTCDYVRADGRFVVMARKIK